MTKIIGNNDGEGGRNDTYKIGSRKSVPRRSEVAEVKRGVAHERLMKQYNHYLSFA